MSLATCNLLLAELRGVLRKPAVFPSTPGTPLKVLFHSLRALLLSIPHSVKNLKSGSTADAVITNQLLTLGLFKRLDGSIAWAEETAYLRRSFGADRAVLQHLPAQYA